MLTFYLLILIQSERYYDTEDDYEQQESSDEGTHVQNKDYDSDETIDEQEQKEEQEEGQEKGQQEEQIQLEEGQVILGKGI